LGSAAIVVLVIVILVVILVAIGWLSLGFNMQFAKKDSKPFIADPLIINQSDHKAFGQFPPNNTASAPVPAPVSPTIVNTPTPTAPNPNFQYLPQKAYVQAYGPEIGIPNSGGILQGVPVVQPAPVVQQAAPANNGFDIGSIMAMVTAAGAGLFAKMTGDKAKKTEAVSKETMGATLDNKELIKEIARVMYQMNPEKANQITDAPSIKLETLKENTDEFRDKVAKA